MVAPPVVDEETGALPSVSFTATLAMLGAALALRERR